MAKETAELAEGETTREQNVARLQRFFKHLFEERGVFITFTENDISSVFDEIDRNGDGVIQEHVLASFVRKLVDKSSVAGYQSLDAIERSMDEIRDDEFDEITMPNTFWCTFMTGKAQ